jgi:hypothetical protein
LQNIFVIIGFHERTEARAVMSDLNMMISLLDVILAILTVTKYDEPVRYSIHINQHGGETVLDVALLCRLSYQFWTKTTTAPELFDSQILANRKAPLPNRDPCDTQDPR